MVVRLILNIFKWMFSNLIDTLKTSIKILMLGKHISAYFNSKVCQQNFFNLKWAICFCYILAVNVLCCITKFLIAASGIAARKGIYFFLPIRWCWMPNSSPLNGKGSPSHNHYRCHYHYKYQHNIRIEFRSVIKKFFYELLKEKPRIKTYTYRSNWHIPELCVFGTFRNIAEEFKLLLRYACISWLTIVNVH